MEPNQPAIPTPTTNAAEGLTASDQSQSVPQASYGAADASTAKSSSPKAAGKSWTEYADLQKVVDQLPQGVRDFCSNSWNKVGNLSTTQKVAGVAALAGLGYLALRSGKSSGKAKSKGASATYRGAQQTYRSGAYTSASQADDSRRMDRGPGQWSGFDRQNENRVGGSYQPSSSDYLAGFNSDETSQPIITTRNQSYRGSAAADELNTAGFGSAE